MLSTSTSSPGGSITLWLRAGRAEIMWKLAAHLREKYLQVKIVMINRLNQSSKRP